MAGLPDSSRLCGAKCARRQRLDHNAHWLSDTVAGAALGEATARFVMNRQRAARDATVSIAPLYHGVMLTHAAHLP